MGFIVKKLGGGISDNTPIKWKFAGRDGEFQSEPERFERNVAFWRNKLGTKAEVEILNKQEEDEPIVSPEPAIESVVESNDSIVIEESVVPQSTEDSIDNPKPKRRKKASDV